MDSPAADEEADCLLQWHVVQQHHQHDTAHESFSAPHCTEPGSWSQRAAQIILCVKVIGNMQSSYPQSLQWLFTMKIMKNNRIYTAHFCKKRQAQCALQETKGSRLWYCTRWHRLLWHVGVAGHRDVVCGVSSRNSGFDTSGLATPPPPPDKGNHGCEAVMLGGLWLNEDSRQQDDLASSIFADRFYQSLKFANS